MKHSNYILGCLPLTWVLYSIREYFRGKIVDNNIEFTPTFTIGWLDFVVTIHSKKFKSIEKAVEEIEKLKISHLFNEDVLNVLKKDSQIQSNEHLYNKLEELLGRNGHVFSITKNFIGLQGENIDNCCTVLKEKEYNYYEEEILPVLTVSCLTGHTDYIAGMIRQIFNKNGMRLIKEIKVDTCESSVITIFNEISIKDYLCGIKRLKRFDLYNKIKHSSKKQSPVPIFEKEECKEYDEIVKKQTLDKRGYYSQLYSTKTSILKELDLEKVNLNDEEIYNDNLDINPDYLRRIKKLSEDFDNLFKKFQENNEYWIRLLFPFRNIITLLKSLSLNPLTLFSLYEMVPFTEKVLDILNKHCDETVEFENGKKGETCDPQEHAVFADMIVLILHDLQRCINNLYREVFPLSQNIDTYTYYKGAVQKIVTSIYGYTLKIWTHVQKLVDDKGDGFKSFDGCCVVDFRNLMTMRNAMPSAPVVYLCPESFFKPEELIDIIHEISHSLLKSFTKRYDKSNKFLFLDRAACDIISDIESDRSYFRIGNSTAYKNKRLYLEIIKMLIVRYLTMKDFKNFIEFKRWCCNINLHSWLKKRIEDDQNKFKNKQSFLKLNNEEGNSFVDTIQNDIDCITPSIVLKLNLQKRRFEELVNLFEETICDSISYLLSGIEKFDDYAFYRIFQLSTSPELWNNWHTLLNVLSRLYFVKQFAEAIKSKEINIGSEIPELSEFKNFCDEYMTKDNWLFHKISNKNKEKLTIWELNTTIKENYDDIKMQYNNLLNIYDDVVSTQELILNRWSKLNDDKKEESTFAELDNVHKNICNILNIKREAIEKSGFVQAENARKLSTERGNLFLSLWDIEMKRRYVEKKL